MNIDLFTSGYGECGLLCNGDLPDHPAGVIFDAQTNELTIEFLEQEPFHLNIPVEAERQDAILFSRFIFIGTLENGEVKDAVRTPLLFLNDPYGGEFQTGGGLSATDRNLRQFEEFMKRCNFAQAAHRDNLSNESAIGSILHGANPKTLSFAPQLLRQQQMELIKGLQGPSGPAGPSGATYTVSNPGLAGPKMPGMGGGSGMVKRIMRVLPAKKPTKQEE